MALVDVPSGWWHDVLRATEAIAARLHPQGALGLQVIDDAGIRRLNQRFRKVDAATDVLSFPGGENIRPGTRYTGDIALSWDAVQRQARANGNTEVAEAVALITHGLLHLAGFDHETAAAQAEMDQLTKELCLITGIEVERFGH